MKTEKITSFHQLSNRLEEMRTLYLRYSESILKIKSLLASFFEGNGCELMGVGKKKKDMEVTMRLLNDLKKITEKESFTEINHKIDEINKTMHIVLPCLEEIKKPEKPKCGGGFFSKLFYGLKARKYGGYLLSYNENVVRARASVEVEVNKAIRILNEKLKMDYDYPRALEILGENNEQTLTFMSLVAEIAHCEEFYREWNELEGLRISYDINKLEEAIIDKSSKRTKLEEKINEEINERDHLLEESSKEISKESFRENLFRKDEINKKIEEKKEISKEMEEDIFTDEWRLILAKEVKEKFGNVFEELYQQYTSIYMEIELIRKRFPENDFLSKLFLKTASTFISREFSRDTDLLKRWLAHGKKAIILDFFLIFGCSEKGNCRDVLRKGDFDLKSSELGKFIPDFINENKEALEYKRYGNPYYNIREVEVDMDKYDEEAGYSFHSKWSDVVVCKLRPVWKERTQATKEEEKIAIAFSKIIGRKGYPVRRGYSKCCFMEFSSNCHIV